jgi:hypothetical protein
MGDFKAYFVERLTYVQDWWSFLVPFWGFESPVPSVPTLSTLIKAGDEGIYASAMFDGTDANFEIVF